MSKIPDIYPIHFSKEKSANLIRMYARDELREAMRYHTDRAEYQFCAKLEKNGDLELSGSFSDDNGFAMSAGQLFRKVVHPWTEGQLDLHMRMRMFEIAEEVYFDRKNQQTLFEIGKIHEELFKRPVNAEEAMSTKEKMNEDPSIQI